MLRFTKMVKCLPEFEYFTVLLKNKNIIFKIRRSKVTDYAALNVRIELTSSSTMYMNMRKMKDLISLSIGMDQSIIYRTPELFY